MFPFTNRATDYEIAIEIKEKKLKKSEAFEYITKASAYFG